MMKRIIPLAAAERLLKTSSATRISDTAIFALTLRLESYGKTIARKAWKFARHAKRKTVTQDDIELAYTELNRCSEPNTEPFSHRNITAFS